MNIQVLDEYDDRGNILFDVDGEKYIFPELQKVINIFREPLSKESLIQELDHLEQRDKDFVQRCQKEVFYKHHNTQYMHKESKYEL